MNFNLVSQLTEEDRTKIENYIYLYGTKDNFIGIDEWLKHWGVNKIKMYKLLGNQFIYRTPFEYHKSKSEMDNQITELIYRQKFPGIFREWLESHRYLFPEDIRNRVCGYINRYILILDKIDEDLTFKLEENKKTLQFQKGMKPIRALSRFLTYCKDVDGVNRVMEVFEQFRIAHSMIFNDKIIKGNMVVSIHPLDFMTMSDNNSNWGSCMSWKDRGCYHVGTIEMLNSNNVLCCYIENSDPYYFSKNKEDQDEDYRWYNKKWRQLVYFTKDIIVSGKPYPYANDEITKALIQIIRDLARKNLHWTYSFGPEEYKDMQYINSSFSMNRARNYIQYGNMTKHNILFDTKGMYNDMLNDSYTNYWCVRNKVKHNKIISYSGKAPCLCCGGQIIYESFDDYDYNDRYGNCGSSVCDDCLQKLKCNFCDNMDPAKKHYKVFLEDGTEALLCEDCIKDYIRKCPDCGKTIFLTSTFGRYNIFKEQEIDAPENYIKLDDPIDQDEFDNLSVFSSERMEIRYRTIFPICRCGECASKDDRFEKKIIDLGHGWSSRKYDILITKEKQRKSDWEKYFCYNLEPASVADGEVIYN